MMKRHNKEYFVIGVSWMLVFAYNPLHMSYASMVGHMGFSWLRVFELWSYTAAFLMLFLLHHFVLVPHLMLKKRTVGYLVGVSFAMAAFVAVLVMLHHTPDVDQMRIHDHRPQLLLAPPDMARVVIALLMLGVDWGITAWMSQQNLKQRLLTLEKQTLKQELDNLHYQINPHFFMNTLNNIHCLIDIDKEHAKDAIIKLSKLMRYSLYEGRNYLVPMTREMLFLQHYISLMRMRYTDRVCINYTLPDNVPADMMIPPLLFGTFLENAFKHGISYRRESFVEFSIAIEDGTIHFRCCNSRFDAEQHKDGIGLANVRKRLSLQYPGRHTFTIDDSSPDRFFVDLVVVP